MCSSTSTSTRSICPTKPMSSPAGRRLARDAEQRAVVAAEADRGLAVAVQAQDDVLVDLADEDHLGDLDGLLVADAQPVDELDRHAEALHVVGDVRAAAVDDDRVQPDVLQQHDVAGELLAQLGVGHRRAAVLDDDRAAVELADVGERLEEGADVAHRCSLVLGRVLRVDGHVLVAEVGEEDLGLRAVAGQPDLVLDLGARAPRRPAPRRRARTAAPPEQTAMPSIAMSSASGAVSGSAAPTACAMRPQFGSAPCSAVLTSGEFGDRARGALDGLQLAAAHDDAADPPGALAVADDQQREHPQQRVERLAEAQLVLGLRRDRARRSRPSTAGSPCRSSTAGRRRRCGRRSA